MRTQGHGDTAGAGVLDRTLNTVSPSVTYKEEAKTFQSVDTELIGHWRVLRPGTEEPGR